MKIDLIHNKLFYLILLGVMFLIPKDVFAYVIYNFDAPKYYLENSNGTQKEKNTTIINYSGGNFYNFSGSHDEFSTFGTIEHFTTRIELNGNIDFSKYSNILISVYGTPIYDFQFGDGTCIPYQSMATDLDIGQVEDDKYYSSDAFYISTYMCSVPTSNIVWIDAFFINTLSINLRMNNRITFIEKNTSTSEISSAINNQTTEITNSIDSMKDMDMNDGDKEMPDDSSYKDYSSTQDELLDKTKEADLDSLDVGLDVKSSSWVWDTLTSLIQSHSVVFGMVIAILSIGVIKLVLGR